MTISVIIPVRNPSAAFVQTLASLEQQTRLPDEVIVVDDGSDTSVVLPSTTLRIHLVRTEKFGAAHARNTGADIATGDVFYFCDGDIALVPDALARLATALETYANAAFAYGAFQWGTMHFPAPAFSFAALKKNNFISTMSMVRRAAFPGFDEQLKRFQDWDLWLTIAERGGVGVPVTGGDLFSVLAAGTMSHRGGWQRIAATRLVREKHSLGMRWKDYWLAWKEWRKEFYAR